MKKGDKKAQTAETMVIDPGFPTIPDQITGQYFPHQKVKPGTRWFYIIGLILAIIGIVGWIIYDIKLFI
jgi:hypothetical protein